MPLHNWFLLSIDVRFYNFNLWIESFKFQIWFESYLVCKSSKDLDIEREFLFPLWLWAETQHHFESGPTQLAFLSNARGLAVDAARRQARSR
jgi:hypothetical protein